jgi:putative DNA primase/helicase
LIGRNYALPALKEICTEINAMPVSASLGDSQKNQAALALSKAQGHVGEIVSNLRYVKSVRTVEAADFDNDPAMLNAPNCVIDLRTGELLPHDPKMMMTQMVKYKFDPDAKNELWEECVRVWSDGREDLALYLQTMAGCVATGYPVEQLFLLHGSTNNGKSSFLETILDVMGTYGVVIDQKLLQPNANNNAEAPSPALATLRGRRVAVVGDWNENARLSEVAVKRLASGDKITARPLNSSPIEFNPTHTILIRTNSLPQVDMGDAAIVRRLVILPWTKNINEGQRDLNLRRRLIENEGGSGILSWIVRGAVRYIQEYQSRGIMPKIPDSAADLMSEHRDENDPHRQWIESQCDIAPDLHESSENIEKNYRQYIQSLGLNPELFSVAKLKSFLRFRGHKSIKIRGTRCWQGLKLKPKIQEDIGIPVPTFDGLHETEVGF